jgi:hypothetical protein
MTTMTTSRIIFQNEFGGVSVIIPTGELSIEEVAAKDVPEGVAYEIVEDDAIPVDRFFRNAWIADGAAVAVDLGKAKDIGHDIRRQQRSEEFQPFDEIIAKQIPGVDAAEAEASRQQIRFKYALIQDAIEIASTPDEIKAALEAAQSPE